MSSETAPNGFATPREDLITTVLGAWLIGGAYLDGWAHRNTLSVLQREGFFTPWHAVLYSGFAAIAGWTFWLAFRRRGGAGPSGGSGGELGGGSGRWWLEAWPVGYRLGAVGVLVFLVGGLADMVWHEIFGVEVSLDALLSPSHLLLAVGAVLLLTSPVRSWWSSADDGVRAAAGVGALALATASIAVFLLYASPFDFLGPAQPYSEFAESHGYLVASHGLTSYLLTAVLIVVPVLLLLQRRPVVGAATAIVTVIALFPVIINEFARAHSAGALMAIAAAACADWILARLGAARGRSFGARSFGARSLGARSLGARSLGARSLGARSLGARSLGARSFGVRWRLPVAGAVVAVLVSSAHLLGLYLVGHIFWPTELWTGMILSVGVVGGLLGWLATGASSAVRRRPDRSQNRDSPATPQDRDCPATPQDRDSPAGPQDRDDLAHMVDQLP
jgi:hypothetical protein